MKQKLKLLALKVTDGSGFQEVECDDSLEDFYKVLEVDCIDITQRVIGGEYFDIICDDNGLLKDDPIPSAIYGATGDVALVGNLIFAKHDAGGNTVGLTDDEIEMIKNNQARCASIVEDKEWDVIILE